MHSKSTKREHIKQAKCSFVWSEMRIAWRWRWSTRERERERKLMKYDGIWEYDNGSCDGIACSTYSFCFILCSSHLRFHSVRNLQSNIKIICITMGQSVVNLKFKIQLSYLFQPLVSWHSLIKLVALSSSYLLIRLVESIEGTISVRALLSDRDFFALIKQFPTCCFSDFDFIRLCPASALKDFRFAYSLCMLLFKCLFKYYLLTSCRISDCVIDFL